MEANKEGPRPNKLAAPTREKRQWLHAEGVVVRAWSLLV